MGGSFKWPSVQEVMKYRQQVRETILQLLDTVPIELPITQESPLVSSGMRVYYVIVWSYHDPYGSCKSLGE